MPEPAVRDVPPHLVYVEPIQDRQAKDSPVAGPSPGRAYVNLGWVVAVADDLEEDISVGDLLVFQPWAEKNIPTKAYHPYHTHNYIVHEDDCILVIEDW